MGCFHSSYLNVHYHFSSCHTLLWDAWTSLLGVLLMVLGGPALGPPELSLLKDKQGQVPQLLPCRACAPDPDHLGVPPLNFPHSIHVLLVPGSETGYRTLTALSKECCKNREWSCPLMYWPCWSRSSPRCCWPCWLHRHTADFQQRPSSIWAPAAPISAKSKQSPGGPVFQSVILSSALNSADSSRFATWSLEKNFENAYFLLRCASLA